MLVPLGRATGAICPGASTRREMLKRYESQQLLDELNKKFSESEIKKTAKASRSFCD